jgi:hypothetical protein
MLQANEVFMIGARTLAEVQKWWENIKSGTV